MIENNLQWFLIGIGTFTLFGLRPSRITLKNTFSTFTIAEAFIYNEFWARFMLVLKIRIEHEEWIYEEWIEV